MILKNNLESIDYNNFAKHSTQQVSNLILSLICCHVEYIMEHGSQHSIRLQAMGS